ncbi:retinol dehydrogenase 12-like [Argiope bruennichi]|uniref:Retinol dehydrogenase 14 like protein n=1 Tax=Argiope bruennichi TaxID=94029 RepID=A0A8T0FSH8_ARGBR|nr:retinol dehydrogenase 12-like [Argiope bruennichi]XP_055938461.1 retinol dehydrogenase 12-like [Argiope bruennichi]XP_055938462.1 retinol dehydrogenase 12-like [Argiope bruennichi]KAF8791663.1 Retinol dehydrogenase 14 like protein [Argiope bruennichi]
MEAMDICLATTKEISYLILNHPIYSAIGAFICFVSLLKFYCRLTLGVYDGDHDLAGKTVLITGASAGIGKAAAYDFARRRARVLLGCRNLGKAERVAREIRSATGNDNVVVKQLDLCSFKSVRECARNVIETEQKLHILVNNAGIAGHKRKLTEDGCEMTMQSNHFGHFLLTLLLLDLLKKSAPSRIINVSSEAYQMANLDLEDLTNEKNSADIKVYANSKLCNILFTKELAQRLLGTGVTVNALHPGCVKTDIMNNSEGLFALMTLFIFATVGKTMEEGAQTTVRLAVDPDLEKTTGKYFMDCKEKAVKGKANDMKLAKSLFELSEKIVGVSFPQT